MDCAAGKHLWTARFYRSGALAFWFCSECGETDRDVEHLTQPLENVAGVPENSPQVTSEGSEPPASGRRWKLSDGSILQEGEPGSTEFRGYPIPGMPDSHQYLLLKAGTTEEKSYPPSIERSSTVEECFILTRYRVEDNRLVKYRIHCCHYSDGETRVDEPSGVTIISDLEPC